MESQGVPKEAEAEGDGILKIGDMQLPGRLISDASEEIMLLWAIGQPCTARQNNFVKQTSNHLKLDACGHNLSIQQSPSSMNTSGVTGGVMWDSGIVLGKFLEHAVDCDLLNLRGKKCVELGSGCGLVGCIAALLGGNAILTDMPDRLRLLAKNVEENVRELDARGSASVRELTWGEDLDSDLLNPLPDYGTLWKSYYHFHFCRASQWKVFGSWDLAQGFGKFCLLPLIAVVEFAFENYPMGFFFFFLQIAIWALCKTDIICVVTAFCMWFWVGCIN
ncbi:uncharacterized protein LOC131067122 isoform X1 [Cryptomeria japonica]|uniref:uncharacterized protein LOC131067122 isoform X1 n=1 Tax=Cryptomeria japonica TaxID=3369 RepID=UPI0027DA169D|nr:uncharacterized protein LOC131067122 isoform X1 [Cryptomeria japonica]